MSSHKRKCVRLCGKLSRATKFTKYKRWERDSISSIRRSSKQTHTYVDRKTELCKIKLFELANRWKCKMHHYTQWMLNRVNEIDLNYLVVVYICVWYTLQCAFCRCTFLITLLNLHDRCCGERAFSSPIARTIQWKILIGLSMWTNGLPIQNISFI